MEVGVTESSTPMAEIGRDDEEGFGVGEVRRKERSERFLLQCRDGTDEDGYELDVTARRQEKS